MSAAIRCYGWRAKRVAGDERSDLERLQMTIFPNEALADTYFEMREMDRERWERVELRVEVVERSARVNESA